MEKNYSVNRQTNGTVIYEIDGALYDSLAQVPDNADRAVLAAMQESPKERAPEEDRETFRGMKRVLAADTARTRMIVLFVFGSIAVIMLLVAAVSSYDAFVRSNIEERASGIVVETVEQAGDEDTVFSYPVVAFTDRDGQSHTVQVPEGSSPPEWSAGDAVTVLYDPANPQSARIDSWSSTLLLWLLPGITGIAGIAFLGAVYLVLHITPPAETR